MATARGVERSLRRNVVDLCWGAWSELGVSGWSRTHMTWAIDPEPLIVFTAIADLDPRLRDEALDWCIRNSRHALTRSPAQSRAPTTRQHRRQMGLLRGHGKRSRPH